MKTVKVNEGRAYRESLLDMNILKWSRGILFSYIGKPRNTKRKNMQNIICIVISFGMHIPSY